MKAKALFNSRSLKDIPTSLMGNPSSIENCKAYLDLACHYRYYNKNKTILPVYNMGKFLKTSKVEKLLHKQKQTKESA
eukprot:CAMPEP_0168351148 /NCGR_PEP_ID=MMETSP0213-20121227/21633_1 /TAXON_ID=151035 /ORGANISM="Euplotes harpa, Strain FSP1.4" /LENGTH=77 /DNA_ID=CAMNT_0008361813 /DNA_START=257 /DNA_END=490 /DNA_ORIENTATION=+